MIKNILRVLSANIIIAIAGLINSLFLPKLLSFEDYADYQTFMLYLSYIAILHIGFPTGMCINYAGKKISEIDKSQYKAEMRIVFVILVLSSLVIAVISSATRSKLIFYVSLTVFPYCFSQCMVLLLQAWGEFEKYAGLHIFMSAVPLLLPLAIYFITRKFTTLVCILSYIIVFAVATTVCLIYHLKIVRGYSCATILSKKNWETEKIGFSFLFGNYINNLFHSIDKQFVRWFCAAKEFSYYSFGLTMQSSMTIFITAISQPLLSYMASGKIKGKDKYKEIKRILMVLGSFSGIAYFACTFVVEYWIPNYLNSLSVIRVYFAVFPAMAVINCLYFNLYKVHKMRHRYIVDVSIMLAVAIAANYIAIKLEFKYIGVAFATTLLNYIWLFYGAYVFVEVKFDAREIIFLFLFIIEFIVIPIGKSVVLETAIYIVCDFMICAFCFPKELQRLLSTLIRKARKFLKS